MAKRILVPLDATDDMEAVLDLIADAARGGGATVRLLHVAPHAETVRDVDGHIVVFADQESARLEGAENIALDGVGHVALAFSSASQTLVLEKILEAGKNAG